MIPSAYDAEKMGEWCSTRPGQTWPDAIIISPELVCGLSRLSQSLARMTLTSSLLLSSLSLHTVLGVITNQGPRWPVEDDEDLEVSDNVLLCLVFLSKIHRTMR